MSALAYSKRTNLVKLSLAFSDFIFFTLSLSIAIYLISFFGWNINEFIPESEMPARFLTHVMLSLVCVAWFWVRLRHYTYRKPFWFELKEIFRTLLIFAVLDLALVAFSKWQFSRFVWILTWGVALLLVPFARAITKRILNKLNLWKKHTIIIGSGKNACDAYRALQSEEVLGFAICSFFSSGESGEKTLFDKPVIANEAELWQLCDPETTQFIVALEFEQKRTA